MPLKKSTATKRKPSKKKFFSKSHSAAIEKKWRDGITTLSKLFEDERFPVNSRIRIMDCSNSSVRKGSHATVTRIYEEKDMEGYSALVDGVGEIFVEFRNAKRLAMTWGELKKLNEKTSEDAEVVMVLEEASVSVERVVAGAELFILFVGEKQTGKKS